MLIQACLNGSRKRGEHPALPITPAEIARDAATVRRAGAGCIHVHPRSPEGLESLDGNDIGAVLRAVREACPGLRIGVSTAAWIEPDLERRLAFIAAWTELPDFASVNLSEEGGIRVIDLLNERGVGVEAGLWDERDAWVFVDNGLDSACLRVLVEVDAEIDSDAAVDLAGAVDAILDDGLSEAPRLHHGSGLATWGVLKEAIDRGHDVRVGLEDTHVLPDGAPAANNEALLLAITQLARAAGRAVEVG